MSETVVKNANEIPLEPTAFQKIVEWEGYRVEMKVYPILRGIRNQALEIAAMEHQSRFGKPGLLPTVFEYELAKRIIREWNLAKPVAVAWDSLPQGLGDAISEAIGVPEALKSLRGQETREVADAKNSS